VLAALFAKVVASAQPILLAALLGVLTAMGLGLRRAALRLPRALLAVAQRWRENAAKTAGQVDDVAAGAAVIVVESLCVALEETFGERKTDPPPPPIAARITLPDGKVIEDRRAHHRSAGEIADETRTSPGYMKRGPAPGRDPPK